MAREQRQQPPVSVTPGEDLARLPSPRVLIDFLGQEIGAKDGRQQVLWSGAEELASKLREAGVPTVVVAKYLGQFDLTEWDVLVTRQLPATATPRRVDARVYDEDPIFEWSWKQAFPDNLSIVCLLDHDCSEMGFIDARPSQSDWVASMPPVLLVQAANVAGASIKRAKGLPESLEALVARTLIPVAKARQSHMSVHANGQDRGYGADLHLTPFLFGPGERVLAGSYPRNKDAEVWLLPDDVQDLAAWVCEALTQWHRKDPKRFPALPGWSASDAWLSHAEVLIAEERAVLDEGIRAQVEERKHALAAIDARAAQAKTKCDIYERALLTSDGDELSEAVACALAEVGFHVIDMDQHWPDHDRREDLRVLDPDEPDWVAIVEVKGAKGGPKETEIHSMGRWQKRFILDEGLEPDASWFVSNHERLMDPSARMIPFSHKPALVEAFRQSGLAIIDTRAIFDALRLVQSASRPAAAVRAALKSALATSPLVRLEVNPASSAAIQDEEAS